MHHYANFKKKYGLLTEIWTRLVNKVRMRTKVRKWVTDLPRKMVWVRALRLRPQFVPSEAVVFLYATKEIVSVILDLVDLFNIFSQWVAQYLHWDFPSQVCKSYRLCYVVTPWAAHCSYKWVRGFLCLDCLIASINPLVDKQIVSATELTYFNIELQSCTQINLRIDGRTYRRT